MVNQSLIPLKIKSSGQSGAFNLITHYTIWKLEFPSECKKEVISAVFHV